MLWAQLFDVARMEIDLVSKFTGFRRGEICLLHLCANKETLVAQVSVHLFLSRWSRLQFKIFRFLIFKRNGSECPCAPAIDRNLEDGEFSVNTTLSILQHVRHFYQLLFFILRQSFRIR